MIGIFFFSLIFTSYAVYNLFIIHSQRVECREIEVLNQEFVEKTENGIKHEGLKELGEKITNVNGIKELVQPVIFFLIIILICFVMVEILIRKKQKK